MSELVILWLSMLGRVLFWIPRSCLIKMVVYYICSHSHSLAFFEAMCQHGDRRESLPVVTSLSPQRTTLSGFAREQQAID